MRRLWFFWVMALMNGPLQAQTTLTLVADLWCPYNCDPESDRPGYAVEVAREVFAHHDIQIRYQMIPWTRAVEMTRSGLFDGIIGAIPIEAQGFVFGQEPIGEVRHTLFTRPTSAWTFESVTSLESVTLGAIQDYSYGADITDYITSHRDSSEVSVLGGNDALERLIQMLLTHRIDTLVEDRTVLQYHLATTAADQPPRLREAGIAARDAIYIAFSPANPASEQYRDLLDNGIQELRRSGRLAAILGAYGVKEWQ